MASNSADEKLDGFFDDLVRCETRLYNALGERLRAAHGIVTSQFELLRYLRDHPRSRVADLATNFAGGIGAISKSVDRLEARGWVARLPNPVDGRSSLISLTASGAALTAEAEQTFREQLRDLVGTAISPAQVDAARTALARLRRALEQARVGLPVGLVDSIHLPDYCGRRPLFSSRRSSMTAAMTPLLERNEEFARAYSPVPLGLPAARVIVITCADHRVDPAITLGLKLGDAPVLRNAGGRVTQSTIEEVAYLTFLGQRMFSGQLAEDSRFEVAVIHHTQCGTGLLVDPDFRHEASEATGVDEKALEATAVGDPYTTVAVDVDRLLASPVLPPAVGVSGHVYDLETGRVTTAVNTRYAA